MCDPIHPRIQKTVKKKKDRCDLNAVSYIQIFEVASSEENINIDIDIDNSYSLEG